MAFLQVDESNFQIVMEEEFAKKNIVILKFGSEFCDACHALEGELEDLEEDNAKVTVLTIDCSDSPDLAERYDVYKLPTMVIYKDAKNMIYKGEGVLLSQDIEELIS